jgi:hypothetical protein
MVEALDALGKTDDAQAARWRYFEKSLNVESLRTYLKRLPDFDDFEDGRKAFEIAAKHRSVDVALEFKLNDVEPFAYLKDVLERMTDGHPMSRIDDLLPWNLAKKPVNQ